MRMLVAILEIRDGQREAFRAYESRAAKVMARHGGRIERAVFIPSPSPGVLEREVHLVSFPDDAALEAYRQDPESRGLASAREACVATTQLLIGEEGPQYRG